MIRFCNETYPPFSFQLDGTSYEESRNNFQNFHSQNLHQPRFTEPIGNPVLISQFRVSTGNTNTLKGTPGLLPFTKIDNPGEGQDGGELIKASLIVNRTLHPFIYIYIYRVFYSHKGRGERKCELVKQREVGIEKSDLANARIVMVVCFSISRRIDARDAQIYADARVCVCVEGGWKTAS